MSLAFPRDSNWKLFRYVVLAAAFEAFFKALEIGLEIIEDWRDLIFIPLVVVSALIPFVSGVQQNCKAVFVKRNSSISAPPDANNLDPSAVLVQKVEVLSSVITEAAYEAFVEALHNLPDRIWNWDDLVKAWKSLLQCSSTFVSLAFKKYKTWLTTRNSSASTVPIASSQRATLEVIPFDIIFEALNDLPDEIPLRQDMIYASQSLWHSLHFSGSQRRVFHGGELVSQVKTAKCFFLRLGEVFCHPSRFAITFLNLCSLVRSFWDGTQSGPEVILPMSSLTKRPSSRLARLLLHHSRDLPQYEFGADVSLSATSHPWTVAMIDLNAVPLEITEGGYSTGADAYGLVSMVFLVMVLDFLIAPSWIGSFYVFPKVIMTLMIISMFGDGTLTLLPPSEGHHTSAPAYALLLDEEFSVVLRGTQNLVETITLGGFHLSYPVTDLLPIPVWKFAAKLSLEGWFQGLLYLMAILPVWRFIRPSFTSPFSQVVGTVVWAMSFQGITLLGSLQRAMRRPGSGIPKLVQLHAEAYAEFVRMAARTVPILGSWYLYIHDNSVFNELQLIMELVLLSCLAFFLSIQSQNYPVRTAKFLDILGKPPVKKWRFKTPAAAATFQCLVLCHGIRRPAMEIDVRGVLDTLIPDQRDVWTTWKTRVADRIIHEMEISFAPTLPTFRDAKLQKQLEVYLDEAQCAYDGYRRWSKAVGFTHR